MTLLRGALLGFLVLGCLSSVAMANTIHMTIDGGDPINCGPFGPTGISTGINAVSANGDCASETYNFTNDLGQIVDGFTFSTVIATGLTLTPGCTTGYFLSCDPTYDPTTGDLTYVFSDTINPPTLFNCCADGADEGIAPGATFHITLDGFDVIAADNPTGGVYTSDVFGAVGGPQNFINTVEVVPEPTTIASLLIGMLLLFTAFAFRQRREWASALRGRLRFAKFALALLVGAAACSASPIFYLVNQTIGAGSVTGFIETDGSLGTITNFHSLLDWNLLLNDGTSTFDLQGPLEAGANSFVLLDGSDLSATPTELLYNFSGTDNGLVLFQNPFIGSNEDLWCPATSTLCTGNPAGESLLISGSFQSTGLSGLQVIAANPEPTTVAFALVGLCGIFLMRRRLVRASAK